MNSTLKSLVFWVVLVLVGGLVWNFSTRFQTAQKPETFSEFMSKVDAGQVARVTFTGNEITYTAKNGEGFRTYAPAQYEGLANKLLERNVAVAAREPTTSPWAALLYSWAPILLMIGFWVFFMRQMQSGGNKALSFGKSRARLHSSQQKKVTFKDVAGVEEADDRLEALLEEAALEIGVDISVPEERREVGSVGAVDGLGALRVLVEARVVPALHGRVVARIAETGENDLRR